MKGKRIKFYSRLLAIVVAIIRRRRKREYLKKIRKTKRQLWSRKWLLLRKTGKDVSNLVFDEFRLEDPKSFQNFTRTSISTFGKLLEKIKPYIEKEDTLLRESITASTRLLLTLRFLATGDSFRDLSYSFRISVPAISLIIPETLQAICSTLEADYLKMPQCKNEWRKIADEFDKKWNFPHCLGALDGKHIAFRAKMKDGSLYYNYKGFNSIVLLALVDANYNFLYVDIGCNGRANDAAVFNNSSLCEGIRQNLFDFPEDETLPQTDVKFPYIIVADEAFRLTTRIIKPHSQKTTVENKIFNYRLSRARRVVENAFGIMANRFQVLQKDINLSVDKVKLITLTTCILHNFIRKEDGLNYYSNVDKENITAITFTPGEWRNNVYLTNLQRTIGNRSTDAGIVIRNLFTYYFNNIGFVPWQWEAIKKFNF